MKSLKLIASLFALATVSMVVGQTFSNSEIFRVTDTQSDVRRKLNQSGVTIGQLANLSAGGLTGQVSVTTSALTVDPTNGVSISRIIHGKATLASGQVVVSNASVTASTRIFLTRQTIGTGGMTNSVVSVSAVNPGSSFTLQSNVGADTNIVAYLFVEP